MWVCAFALQQRTDRCGQQSVCSLSVLTAVDVDVGVDVCNCSAAKDWPLRAAICVQFVSAHRCGCGCGCGCVGVSVCVSVCVCLSVCMCVSVCVLCAYVF